MEQNIKLSKSSASVKIKMKLLDKSRSPLLGACNFHNKPMQRPFFKPVYF